MGHSLHQPPKVPLGQSQPYRPIDAETLRKLRIKDTVRKIRTAWVAAIVSGVITLALTLVSITGTRVLDINAWMFLDVALVFGLAYGIYKKSRVCALLVLIHFIASKILIWTVSSSLIGLPVALLFLYCYVQGVIGTFRFHRLMGAARELQPDAADVGPLNLGVMPRQTGIVRRALGTCRQFRRALLVLNIVYFGLFVLGFAFARSVPQASESLLQNVKQGFSEGPLAPVMEAYVTGDAPKAIFLTFAFNLVFSTFFFITVPSLILPFSGLLTGSVRALAWGVLIPLSVLSTGGSRLLLLVLVLVALEGEAYVVAMLAAFVQGRCIRAPALAGATKRGEAYKIGLRVTGYLYVVVASLLAVAAVYEVLLSLAIRR